ncbi:MAG TPA: protein kinase [Gemmatimonadaceae bacterium]|jgi:TolB-like protein/tRNA A-37 threonylcarbamoyl transferase component Bud32/tetratricopeptide (TPR) repeat protein|nr:protein kinase [Gemmatimonadaceae bacterium]
MDLRERLHETLGSAYLLERELEGGGMSRVFLATESALARRVVIKVLSPDLAAGLSAQRFTREIRLAAALQQANIVPVLTAGEADELPYYVMPFVAGLSLRDRLTRDGRLEIPAAVGVLRDVARALAYAHDNGVVHRDIKPENVLLSGEAAVVTDFGIAKAISAAQTDTDIGRAPTTTYTVAGMAIGTPAYMSPEQISSDPTIDHRADLYSFGCLAYEILSGRSPFAGRAAHQLFAAHLSERPASVETLRPDCPASLARLVTQCLEKDPARRPISAHEILRALDSSTAATTGVRRLVNRMSRRQRVVGVVGAAVVALGAIVVGARVWPRTAHAATDASSLAILPVVNVGGDTAKNIWAEGLTDQVATTLARAANLRLATRTSVDRYRNRRNVDAREVGRALQVRHVLQATLWPQRNRVLVVALLSNADDGRELWRDSFERDASDILATLDSITNAITAAVQRHVLHLTGPVLAATSLRGTSDTTAYELYLRGQTLLRARGSSVRRAVELFEQATAHDGKFARAHAGLAAALEVLPNFADTTYAEVHDRATLAARRALQLDSTLAEAQTALALASMHALRWAEADSEFRRAIALDPSDPTAHFHYARYLIYVGRPADAVVEMQNAKRMDPTSAVVGGWLARLLLSVNRRTEAFAEIDRALELDSMSVPASFMGAEIAVARGQRERARRLAEISWRPQGVLRSAPWPGGVALLYGEMGDQAMVRTIISTIESNPQSRAYGHASRAMAALGARDTARALDELERATDAQEFWPSAPILILPRIDVLRSSKRFKALIRRIGLDTILFTTPTAGRYQ